MKKGKERREHKIRKTWLRKQRIVTSKTANVKLTKKNIPLMTSFYIYVMEFICSPHIKAAVQSL